jgi:esterase/lipase
MDMIHVFHGFLGSPGDFEFLENENVRLHDLYQSIPETHADDTLIGYSMGGRLAMELAKKNGFKNYNLKLVVTNCYSMK